MKEPDHKPIVVSLHKSGTNLVTRLFKAMDFTPIGAGVSDSYELIFRKLDENKQSLKYQQFLKDRQSILADSSALLELCLTESKLGTCVFLHDLDLEKKEELSSSSYSHNVPIVFNYRDPRAVLVSFVHYLTNSAREDFTRISGYVELSQILKRLATQEERLAFVMEFVPNYLNGAFLANSWLLSDPEVLSISYEVLVGVKGGGSDDKQLSTIARLMEHLGVTGEAQTIAHGLYDTKSRTFRKGNVASWRDEFTPKLTEIFVEKYGEILETYGYGT